VGNFKSNRSMEHWIGIDVSRATLEVALIDDRGTRLCSTSVKNDRKAVEGLFKRLSKEFAVVKEDALVCLEPTSPSLSQVFRAAGHFVWAGGSLVT
jgi:transposase